ncbi:hypothetical protein DFP79_0374 [Marinomonas balearica]|uniref:Uncharacterized protein n=1 Tax=Marinomonas balearica TaxID=491947 RepID=A0A4R6MCX3_9GAMM|nr:hypothetical protein DFP79_0374 [Marinomonas balearica]
MECRTALIAFLVSLFLAVEVLLEVRLPILFRVDT